jgi:dCMP deaminase
VIDEKWRSRFLEMAFKVASWSKDPSTKVGAVVTKDKQLVSVGFNGAPSNIDDNLALSSREMKLACTIHAEHNALEFSEKTDLTGHTVYITHPPCERCAALLVKRNVSTVVWVDVDEEWKKRWNNDLSMSVLRLGGISTIVYSPDKRDEFK